MTLDRMQVPIALGVFVLAVCLVCGPRAQEAEETFGCEANPTGNPIGGGEGYIPIFTEGDFSVTNADELVAALKQAQPGQIIHVAGEIEIDLTPHPTQSLPPGVTLAGIRGLDGSRGGLIAYRKSGRMFSTAGESVRLTGLRFEGAEGGTGRVATSSSFIGVGHWGFEIDNCEVFNFNSSAIGLGPDAVNARVHHNHIHHNQMGGLGYGVSTSSSDARIIANIFDHCRHHIASSGSPGSGYEAAWNLVLENATSHHFDMHGGRDRGDGTDIAGDWMHIHHNTFVGTHRHVVIRGVPSDGAEIHNNWFANPAAKSVTSGGNTRVYRNVYGPEKTLEE